MHRSMSLGGGDHAFVDWAEGGGLPVVAVRDRDQGEDAGPGQLDFLQLRMGGVLTAQGDRPMPRRPRRSLGAPENQGIALPAAAAEGDHSGAAALAL
jgi:hypothetical protein